MSTLNLTIDIETIPTQDPEYFKGITVNCPANITKPESIAKWEVEKKPGLIDAAYRKTALDSTKGEICVIAWAVNDEEPRCVYRKLGESEADLLTAFFDCMYPLFREGYYSNTLWIGHNLLAFDLPFIKHRAIINKVNTSIHIPYRAKPWADNIFDTKMVWKAASNASSSLDAICKAIGIPVKEGMKGSEVWDYMKAGEVEKVADYCRLGDVVATRSLFKLLQ